MTWKQFHNTISTIICLTLIGVLGSTLSSDWWSCGDDDGAKMLMWLAGIGSIIYGIALSLVAKYYSKDNQLKYWSELTLRVMLVYALFTTALLKAEGLFYNYTLFNGETKLANLEANTFANAFYGFSPFFQAYVGYAIIGGLVLICFKQTQRLGNILMAVILVNAIILNYSFQSCYIFKNSVYLSVIAFFIFVDLPAYFAFFTRQPVKIKKEYHPLTGSPHLIHSAAILKIILLIGFYFYSHYYIEDAKEYRNSNVHSPITGVWKVTDVKFLKKDLPQANKKDIESFKSIILDKGRFGAVEVEDSLSFFEYIIEPDDNQLVLWNFQDYWELNIKGKYTQITKDSIIYIGRNRKDSLQISLKLDSK